MSEDSTKQGLVKGPIWAPLQNRIAVGMLVASVGLFVIEGMDKIFFHGGQEVSFGILPKALFAVSIYVLFGINLPEILERRKNG